MQDFYFKKTSEIRRAKEELEEKLNVKIKIDKKKVTMTGEPLDEYESALVIDAINFGFSAKKALFLKQEDMIFRVINIKDITRKKNLKEVRARMIGTQGATRKTIENITSNDIIIKDNEVGIIGNAEGMDEVITAVSNLIKGTKQSNTYRYLEKMNRRKRNKD